MKNIVKLRVLTCAGRWQINIKLIPPFSIALHFTYLPMSLPIPRFCQNRWPSKKAYWKQIKLDGQLLVIPQPLSCGGGVEGEERSGPASALRSDFGWLSSSSVCAKRSFVSNCVYYYTNLHSFFFFFFSLLFFPTFFFSLRLAFCSLVSTIFLLF